MWNTFEKVKNDEKGKRPESGMVRFLATLLLVILGVGCIGLDGMLHNSARKDWTRLHYFQESGVTVSATVISKEVIGACDCKTHYIDYAYELPVMNGTVTSVSTRVRVSEADYNGLEIGAALPVVYDPQDSSRSELAAVVAEASPAGLFPRFSVGLALIAAAILLLLRLSQNVARQFQY